jgi:NADH-ubiquinone oxidoreductase chain 3
MTSLTFFLIFVPILAILLLAINLILAIHNPYQEKDSAFECGFHSFLGQNRTQFSIVFFIFALLFLLFDLEILLVYPYIVSHYINGIYGLIIMLIFFLLLTLGFFFEIGKKALIIYSKQNNTAKSTYNKKTITHKASILPIGLKNPYISKSKKKHFHTNNVKQYPIVEDDLLDEIGGVKGVDTTELTNKHQKKLDECTTDREASKYKERTEKEVQIVYIHGKYLSKSYAYNRSDEIKSKDYTYEERCEKLRDLDKKLKTADQDLKVNKEEKLRSFEEAAVLANFGEGGNRRFTNVSDNSESEYSTPDSISRNSSCPPSVQEEPVYNTPSRGIYPKDEVPSLYSPNDSSNNDQSSSSGSDSDNDMDSSSEDNFSSNNDQDSSDSNQDNFIFSDGVIPGDNNNTNENNDSNDNSEGSNNGSNGSSEGSNENSPINEPSSSKRRRDSSEDSEEPPLKKEKGSTVDYVVDQMATEMPSYSQDDVD